MNGSKTRVARGLQWLRHNRLLILIGLTYAWFFQGGDPNQTSRYLLARNLVERVSPDITPEHPLTIDKAKHAGRFYSDKAPGVSALAVVPYAALAAAERVTGLDPNARTTERARLHALVIAVSGLAGVLAAAFLRRVLVRLGSSEREASVLTFGYALGTLAFPFSTVLFGHQVAAALLIASFALCLDEPTPASGRRGWMGLGALWAFAIAVEYPTGPLVAALGLYLMWCQGEWRGAARAFCWTCAGALPVLGAHAAYTQWAFGSPLVLPYKYVFEPIFRAHGGGFLGVGMPRLYVAREALVGTYRGLFFLCPFLILSIAGIGEWIRRGERTREAALAIAVSGASLLLTAGYNAWDGDFSTGPRHLIPALPFLVLPIAWWMRKATWAAWTVYAAIVPSVLLMTACTAVLVQTPTGDPATTNPVYALVLPALARDVVATNQLDAFHASWQADAAYNLGTLFGLSAWSSLLVPVVAWLAAYSRDLLPSRTPA